MNKEVKCWTEGTISVWRSAGVEIKNEVFDGGNGMTGTSDMFDRSSHESIGGLIDNVEVRNIKSIKIRINNRIKFKLLYNKNNSLTKKIKLEQSRKIKK